MRRKHTTTTCRQALTAGENSEFYISPCFHETQMAICMYEPLVREKRIGPRLRETRMSYSACT